MKKIRTNLISLFIIVTAAVFISAFACCSGNSDKKSEGEVLVQDINTVIKTDSSSDTKDTGQVKVSAPVKKDIIYLTDQNFDKITGSGIVLVDFWAPWCGPCRMQAPILEKVNTEMAGKVTIAKIDIDQNPTTPDKFGVMNIPTLIMFKDGNQVNKFVGLTQKEVLIEAINKVL